LPIHLPTIALLWLSRFRAHFTSIDPGW